MEVLRSDLILDIFKSYSIQALLISWILDVDISCTCFYACIKFLLAPHPG